MKMQTEIMFHSRKNRWDDFYKETPEHVVGLLESKLNSAQLKGSQVSGFAGLHSGFWNKFKNGETSPGRKSLFSFCRALGMSVTDICLFYRKGYIPTASEILNWTPKHILRTTTEQTKPQSNEAAEQKNKNDSVDDDPQEVDAFSIEWLKSRGFKIQRPVTVTTFQEI